MRHTDIDQNHDAHNQPTTRNLETSHLAQQRMQRRWGREWQGMQIVLSPGFAWLLFVFCLRNTRGKGKCKLGGMGSGRECRLREVHVFE